MRTKQAYQVLGVQAGCTALDARAAYLAKARQQHPDQPGGDHAAMAQLSVAYHVVQRHITERREPCVPCGGSGRVLRGRGFQRTAVTCPACGGEGSV
jgi:DnaJ-class molecular chaperone